MRSLQLGVTDGVPSAWTPAAVAHTVQRLPELVDLVCPWIGPKALATLRALERIGVTPTSVPDASEIDTLFSSLPQRCARWRLPPFRLHAGDFVRAVSTPRRGLVGR